jgi:hypothetical protein
MPISRANIEVRMEAAVAALDAGDYNLALTQALGAAMLLKSLPDQKHGDVELRWSQEGIDVVVQEIRAQKAAANVQAARGVLRVPVCYRPTGGACDGY